MQYKGFKQLYKLIFSSINKNLHRFDSAEIILFKYTQYKMVIQCILSMGLKFKKITIIK